MTKRAAMFFCSTASYQSPVKWWLHSNIPTSTTHVDFR